MSVRLSDDNPANPDYRFQSLICEPRALGHKGARTAPRLAPRDGAGGGPVSPAAASSRRLRTSRPCTRREHHADRRGGRRPRTALAEQIIRHEWPAEFRPVCPPLWDRSDRCACHSVRPDAPLRQAGLEIPVVDPAQTPATERQVYGDGRTTVAMFDLGSDRSPSSPVMGATKATAVKASCPAATPSYNSSSTAVEDGCSPAPGSPATKSDDPSGRKASANGYISPC